MLQSIIYGKDNIIINFISILAILGLFTGSFLCFISYKLPLYLEKMWHDESQSFLFPHFNNSFKKIKGIKIDNSWRTNCRHQLPWWRFIPVIGYFIANRKCTQCKKSIPYIFPVVEIITSICTACLGYIYGISFLTLFFCIFCWIIILLSVIDIHTKLLPDQLTLSLLWIGLLINSFNFLVPAQSAVLGIIAGYSFLWIVYMGFKFFTGKEGLGYGDFKLFAALGAWFGIAKLPIILLSASFFGTCFGILMLVFKKTTRENPLPFGPFLALAATCVVFYPGGSDRLLAQIVELFFSIS